MMSNYLESYQQRLVTALHLNITREKERVTLREVSQRPLPEVFQACAKTYARREFQAERPYSIEKHPRYQFEDEELLALGLDALDDLLMSGFLFTEEEIIMLVDFSVKLQIQMTVRPRQTLVELLFQTRHHRSIEDAVIVAEGFGSERVFMRNLVEALKALPTEMISLEDFEELARSVEQKVFKVTPISALLRDIELLLDFESSLIDEPPQRVRTGLLLEMLSERALHDFYDEIQRRSERQFWTVEQIGHALERFLLMGPWETSEEPGLQRNSDHGFEKRFKDRLALTDPHSFNGF